MINGIDLVRTAQMGHGTVVKEWYRIEHQKAKYSCVGELPNCADSDSLQGVTENIASR